jgi:hypothetical protein
MKEFKKISETDYVSTEERFAKLYTDSLLTSSKMYHGKAKISLLHEKSKSGNYRNYYIALSINDVTKMVFVGNNGANGKKLLGQYLRRCERAGIVDPREYFNEPSFIVSSMTGGK